METIKLAKELDQFFTKKNIAKELFNKLNDYLQKEQIIIECWLEPSAGSGAFFNLMPENKIGIDIDPKMDHIIKADFLQYPLTDKNYITLGNPPFGKNSSLAIKFFNCCAKNSIVIAFVVPKTFKKQSVINKLNLNFYLEYSEDLPDNSFELNEKDYDVPCVFQIWKKRDIPRAIINEVKIHEDFNFCNRENASFAIQRVGVNAGKVKNDLIKIAEQSHYFIKSSIETKNIFENIDWSSVKYNTAGNPSISKGELVKLYNTYKGIKI